MTVLVLMENNAASSLSLALCLVYPLSPSNSSLIQLLLSFAYFVNHSDLLIVTPSQTAHHVSLPSSPPYPLFLILLFLSNPSLCNLQISLLPLPSLSAHLSRGWLQYCTVLSESLCALGLETRAGRHRGSEKQIGRESWRDSKQNPDFINVGLLIWVWAALHLSQQEQHTE